MDRRGSTAKEGIKPLEDAAAALATGGATHRLNSIVSGDVGIKTQTQREKRTAGRLDAVSSDPSAI